MVHRPAHQQLVSWASVTANVAVCEMAERVFVPRSCSLGRFRVARAGELQPADAGVVVDEVPDPSAAGDFVLPLR